MIKALKRWLGIREKPEFYCPVWGQCYHRDSPLCTVTCGIRRQALESYPLNS